MTIVVINVALAIMVGAAVLVYAKRGAFAGVTTFLVAFIASMAAINYYRLIEYVLVWAWDGMAPYADAMALLLSFLVVFLLLQLAAVTFVDEHTEMNALANALGGAVFGGMAAMLLAGLLSISWLMLPGSAYFLGDDPKEVKVIFDADQLFLTTARFMANDRIQGSGFDPMHNFMKVYTNKSRAAPGISTEQPEEPPRRKTGLADDVNLKRDKEEP